MSARWILASCLLSLTFVIPSLAIDLLLMNTYAVGDSNCTTITDQTYYLNNSCVASSPYCEKFILTASGTLHNLMYLTPDLACTQKYYARTDVYSQGVCHTPVSAYNYFIFGGVHTFTDYATQTGYANANCTGTMTEGPNYVPLGVCFVSANVGVSTMFTASSTELITTQYPGLTCSGQPRGSNNFAFGCLQTMSGSLKTVLNGSPSPSAAVRVSPITGLCSLSFVIVMMSAVVAMIA